MAGVFGDCGSSGILRIFRAAGAGDHFRKRHDRHHRAHRADFVAPGNGGAKFGVSGIEINDHIAVATRPGGRGKDGSVHCAVGTKKRNSYVYFKTGLALRDGFEMHIAVSFFV